MVFSFKISKTGSRYRPKPKPKPQSVHQHDDDEVDQLPKLDSTNARKRSADDVVDDSSVAESSEAEVSFILNIFPDGYTVVDASKNNFEHQNVVEDAPKYLRPYDRRSESMITAIECGHLPVDFLEDISYKYTNGAVLCEVRDYRKESSESEVNDNFTAAFPSITKVSLKMSLDNVVNDIHLIANSTWEYGDLLKAESRILFALQPKLCLDPTPNLDRLCKEPTSVKLNLDIHGKRVKRLRQVSTPESSNSSGKDLKQVTGQQNFVNLVDNNLGQSNMVAAGPRIYASENSDHSVREWRQVMGQPNLVTLGDQNVGQSNMVTAGPKNQAPQNSNMRVGDLRWITGQPDIVNLINQNVGQSSIKATGPKNNAQDATISLVSHHSSHQIGVGNSLNMQDHVRDINSRLVMSPANDKRDNHCQVISMVNSNKRGRSTHVNLDGNQHTDNINAHKHHFTNTKVQQPLTIQQINDRIFNQYNVKREPVETEAINTFDPNRFPKRVPQQFTRENFHKAPWNNMSPNLENSTSVKGFSSDTGGQQFGVGITSAPVVCGTRCLTSGANETIRKAQMAENWKPNTLQMAPVIRGLESSSSVGNMIGPLTDSLVDISMLDRFYKIQMLTARSNLNFKKNKIDDYKPTAVFCTQQLEHILIKDYDDEILEDGACKMPLSKSLRGGNINICKTRVLNFVQKGPSMPEKGFPDIPKFHSTRLILSERQSDGTVAMHLGELDGVDYLAEDELLPTLPNTYMADLLAEQFRSLILRDGYLQAGDHLKPKPISKVQSTSGQSNTTSEDFNRWLQKILESYPIESSYIDDEPSIGGANHHNMHPQSIGLFPGVSATRMHPQSLGFPRVSSARMHPHVVINNNNRESQLQSQFLRQQKQSQFQRGMIMRTDGIGHRFGSNNNSMVGFEGLGMGGNGRVGTGVVSPTNMSGGLLGQSSNFGGLEGANRQIQQGSGPGSGSSGLQGSGTSINRVNDMNPMQRNVMASPHLLSRLNYNQNHNRYINQHQFQLIKQEPTSHLQAVVFPARQAGSPSSSTGRPRQQMGPHHQQSA